MKTRKKRSRNLTLNLSRNEGVEQHRKYAAANLSPFFFSKISE